MYYLVLLATDYFIEVNGERKKTNHHHNKNNNKTPTNQNPQKNPNNRLLMKLLNLVLLRPTMFDVTFCYASLFSTCFRSFWESQICRVFPMFSSPSLPPFFFLPSLQLISSSPKNLHSTTLSFRSRKLFLDADSKTWIWLFSVK